MAEIYLATSTGPEGFHKEVVIKRIRSFLAGDSDFVEMFKAEARLASRLEHPNVVQIFDFDKHEDTYYLAMEYVRGCSVWELRRRCREQGRALPAVLVAQVGVLVARGLHYAHRLVVDGQPLHLVHRDVTPQNVLLSLDGAVKLTDFGIAKRAGHKHTAPGVLKGKFSYMSPEQARGDEVDARTDLFALGVVLWEMLTGGRLFDGDSEVAVLKAVQQSAIAPPARLNPEVPQDLSEVVLRALQRDPALRFQTAGELERALGECVLRHARSVDDTDVGAFVRQVLEADRGPGADKAREPEAAPQPVPTPVREPTVAMPGSRSGRQDSTPRAVEADSVLYASTQVLAERGEPGASSATAEPRSAEPVAAVPSASAPQRAPGPAAAVAPAAPPPGRRTPWAVVAAVAVALVAGAAVLSLSRKGQEAPAAPPAAAPAAHQGAVSQPRGRTTDEPAAGASAGDSEQPAAPAEATTPQEQAPGTLVIIARPYAKRVLLDGKVIAEELDQNLTLSLPAGRHRLVFQHDKKTEACEFTLKPGGRKECRFDALQ